MFAPCIRIFRQGFTFRWQRGDEVMTVQLGNFRDGTLAGVIDRVSVPPDGWVDQTDVRRRANAWLTQAARQSPKTTAGAGASPTLLPPVGSGRDTP
jgi:hypothetical protein